MGILANGTSIKAACGMGKFIYGTIISHSTAITGHNGFWYNTYAGYTYKATSGTDGWGKPARGKVYKARLADVQTV